MAIYCALWYLTSYAVWHFAGNRANDVVGITLYRLIRISVVSFTLTSLNDTTEMLFYSLRSA